LYVEKAGLTIPYLNVDYELSDRSVIDLVGQRFLFRNNTLTDSKFNTKGTKWKYEHILGIETRFGDRY
jgi:hypothetical protein